MEIILITVTAVLFIVCISIGYKFLFDLAKCKTISKIAMEKILNTAMMFMLAGVTLAVAVCGALVLANQEPKQPDQAVLAKEIAEANYICYEIVETVAEYTNYNELEIIQFFVIVSDDMEVWDAIKILDGTLTDVQIEAIMEISAMKQEQAQ